MARSGICEVSRGRRLVSPSPQPFPSLEEISPLPISHLNNITTYLSDWKADRRHARRPQPPTPTRMAANNRSTSTAIPGPASGTSRRLTSMHKPNKSCLIPLLSPEKARRPSQRRPMGNKTDLPPSSYHLPRSLLPRSESLLTDFENDQNLESVFDSPETPGDRLPGLPKSQTTPALLSPNKDVASRSLLKPIGPPLPRSNTYNDISTARTYPTLPRRLQTSTSKIIFDDVKMPERLDIQIPRIKSPYPQISNTLLPQIPVQRVNAPRLPPCTIVSPAPSVIEIPSNPEADPRFVYEYELSSYWTGRYVALLDRLRTRRFISQPSSKNALARGNGFWGKSLKPKEGVEYARIEVNIEKEAMKILRSFCQTKAATESFEHFEYLIRREHIESVRGSETTQSFSTADMNSKETKIHNSQSVAVLDDPKTDRWILSGTLPQRIFRKASSTIQQQPKVQKSMTTGNLCNPHIYIGSNSSFEGSGETYGSIQHSTSAVTLQSPVDCRPTIRTLPKPNEKPRRIALRTPSDDHLNIEASRNFSHRDVKQTAILVEGESSMNPVSTKSSDETTVSVAEITASDSSRRFRKSSSMKQLVDYSIREMKKMGKRKGTSGTTDEMDEI